MIDHNSHLARFFTMKISNCGHHILIQYYFQLSRDTALLHNNNNTAIAISSQVKYLGVLIDDKLHFSEHINKACEKASKKMYVVRRFSKYGAKVSLTKQLFSSFIESYLFQCLVIIFNHAYSTDEKQLKRPYNACKQGI